MGQWTSSWIDYLRDKWEPDLETRILRGYFCSRERDAVASKRSLLTFSKLGKYITRAIKPKKTNLGQAFPRNLGAASPGSLRTKLRTFNQCQSTRNSAFWTSELQSADYADYADGK